MLEDVEYKENPMMKFYPSNSGSLSFSAAKTQKRAFIEFKPGCGIKKSIYDRLLPMWNSKKLYSLLKNGEIAVARDNVVEETVGMDATEYTLLAKNMCLRMEENVRLGKGRGQSQHWFRGRGGSTSRGGGGGEGSGTRRYAKRVAENGGVATRGATRKKAIVTRSVGRGARGKQSTITADKDAFESSFV